MDSKEKGANTERPWDKITRVVEELKIYRLKALFCTKLSPWQIKNVSLKVLEFFVQKKGTNPVRRSLSSGATTHNNRSRVVPDSLLVSTSSRLRTDSQGHDEVCPVSFDLLGCPTRHESLLIGQPSSRVAVFTCAYVFCWIYCHWGNTRIMLGLLLAKLKRSLIVIWMNGIASQKAIWHDTNPDFMWSLDLANISSRKSSVTVYNFVLGLILFVRLL